MRNLPPPTRDNDRTDLKKAVRRYRYRGVDLGHDITDSEVDEVVELYDRYEEEHGGFCDELKGGHLSTSLLDTIHAAYEKRKRGGASFRSAKRCSKGSISVQSAGSIHRPSWTTIFRNPSSSHFRSTPAISCRCAIFAITRSWPDLTRTALAFFIHIMISYRISTSSRLL